MKMKTIVCTGDSHTCGQGATGFYTDLDGVYNTAGKGIGRNMAFDGKGYVNLLRDGICRLTHSSAYEILPQSLDGQGKYSAQSRLLKLCGPLSVLASGDLALVLLGETQSPAVADIYVNQKPYKTLRLETKAPRYDGFSFKYVPVFCEGGGRIEIVPRQGEVFARHILVFCGCICGGEQRRGLVPCGRYLSECFDDGVEVFRPDLIGLRGAHHQRLAFGQEPERV